jgi:hypothetical protein
LGLTRKILLTICLLFLGGCVAYHPKPLDLQARLPTEIPRLSVDPATLHLPHLPPHTFDPRDGLDSTEVAILAVVNNPGLRADRDAVGVARAQAFAAGLLPDPQLSAGLDFPTNSVAGSTSTAYSLGLNYDLNALLTRNIARGAARAEARKADLDLLWKEWQTASRARLLFARSLEQHRLMEVLREYRKLLASRYDRIRQALRETPPSRRSMPTWRPCRT